MGRYLLLALMLARHAATDPCADGKPVVVGTKTYGTKYSIVSAAPAGSPAVAAPNTAISALVVGTLKNGTLFWNSSSPPVAKPPHPGWFDYNYTMPVKGLIVGFDVGNYMMKQGETRQLCIPAAEGYGNSSRPGIPAQSTLIFTITAEKVTPP